MYVTPVTPFTVHCILFCCHILKGYWLPPTYTGLSNIYISTHIWTLSLYLQIAQSTGSAAGVGGGGLAGVVLGLLSVLPPPGSCWPPCCQAAHAHPLPTKDPAVAAGTSPAVAQGTSGRNNHPYSRPPHWSWGSWGPLPAVSRGRSWVWFLGQEKGWGPCIFTIIIVYFSPPTLFCSRVVREPMSWRGSVWSSATSNTGARGPPVRSCSSGWGASTGGKPFPLSPGEFLHQLLPMYMYFIVSRLYLLTLVLQGWSHLEEPAPLHQDGTTMARSPPHAGACASSRDNRGGGLLVTNPLQSKWVRRCSWPPLPPPK